MKPRQKFSRRAFLAAGLLSAPCVVVADAMWLEPQWVKIRRLRLIRTSRPTASFISAICITKATAPTRSPSWT